MASKPKHIFDGPSPLDAPPVTTVPIYCYTCRRIRKHEIHDSERRCVVCGRLA